LGDTSGDRFDSRFELVGLPCLNQTEMARRYRQPIVTAQDAEQRQIDPGEAILDHACVSITRNPVDDNASDARRTGEGRAAMCHRRHGLGRCPAIDHQ
jgi:hypothetical protein